MRSLIHSTMWWNGLRRFRGASVQQAWHANLTKVSKIQGGRQTRRPRRQHSSLQWLIRLVTYTMVSLCSLLQACRLLAATRGSIPYWLLPTMGYHSWEWTCYHTMFQKKPNQLLQPPIVPRNSAALVLSRAAQSRKKGGNRL